MALQELQVNGSTHFGNVSVGQYSEITIVLKNSTSPSIAISGNVPTLSTPFSVQSGGGGFTLAANGNTKNVVVRYTPTDPAQFQTTTLNITHNAPNPASPLPVVFDGTGVYLFDQTRKTAAGDVRVLVYGTASYATPFSDCDLLKKLSPLEHGFDDQDESVFFPSNVTITLRDPTQTAYNRLKGNEDKVEIYLAGNLEYVGIVDINANKPATDFKTKESSFTIYDKSNSLKNLRFKDSTGAGLNPFGYTYDTGEYLTDVIADCFKWVNPAVTVTFGNDWDFKDFVAVVWTFAQLQINTIPWFFQSSATPVGPINPSAIAFGNAVEMLKNLALNFGCIVGMKNYNEAYFIKRFKRSGSPTALTDATNVKQAKPKSFFPIIEGVQTNSVYMDGSSQNQRNDGTVTMDGVDFRYPNKVLQIVWYPWSKRTDGRFGAQLYNNNASPPVYNDSIGTARDTNIDTTYRDFAVPAAGGGSEHHLGKYYLSYLGVPREQYEFILYGVGFSITDQFSYNSKTFRPQKISRDFEKNETTMLAIEVT